MSYNTYQLAGVLEAPIISEKSTNAAEKNKQFVFKVLKTASKKQVKNAVEVMFSVSLPAPPLMLSPAFNVWLVAVFTDVNTSSPAAVVLRSTPESSVYAATGIAAETVAYVPPVLPAVCDKACDASTLVLKVATEAP